MSQYHDEYPDIHPGIIAFRIIAIVILGGGVAVWGMMYIARAVPNRNYHYVAPVPKTNSQLYTDCVNNTTNDGMNADTIKSISDQCAKLTAK
jgi:hypothetical protein